MRNFTARSWVLAVCVFINACAPSRSVDHRSDAAVAEPTTLVMMRGEGGRATWDQLIDACASADAVLIGESHGQKVGQAFQARLFRDLLARAPGASGALEFFERDEQAALNDYLSGVTSEAEFRAATRRTESNYPSGHRAIVEACKAAKRPVSAANASRRYVRLARMQGFDRLAELTPEQKRLFVIPEFIPEGRYRDDFFKVMGGDDLKSLEADPKQADAAAKRRQQIADGLRSQSVWDWTMANSVAQQIEAGGAPVVLIVGRFHIEHSGGLVQALKHMRPGTRIVTISGVDAWSEELRKEDEGAADFVVYTGE